MIDLMAEATGLSAQWLAGERDAVVAALNDTGIERRVVLAGMVWGYLARPSLGPSGAWPNSKEAYQDFRRAVIDPLMAETGGQWTPLPED